MSYHYYDRRDLTGSNLLETCNNTTSSFRTTSDFSSDLNCRRYGRPELRTTKIEIRHSSPFPIESGQYIPRTTRRDISVTSMHARHTVPVSLCGEDGERGRLLSDIKFSYPSTARCMSVQRCTTPVRSASRFRDLSRGVSMHRFESGSSGPITYSQRPRFSSRFYRSWTNGEAEDKKIKGRRRTKRKPTISQLFWTKKKIKILTSNVSFLVRWT